MGCAQTRFADSQILMVRLEPGHQIRKWLERQPWNLLQVHEMEDGMNATKFREGI